MLREKNRVPWQSSVSEVSVRAQIAVLSFVTRVWFIEIMVLDQAMPEGFVLISSPLILAAVCMNVCLFQWLNSVFLLLMKTVN